MNVKVRRFSSRAHSPQKSTQGSSGYDLLCSRNIVLEPNTTQRILIDIGFCFSSKYFAKVYFHSSLSLHSIECEGGVIDSDFRGNMNVISHNLSNKQVEFETGDRASCFSKM